MSAQHRTTLFMSYQKYKATLSGDQNRSGWCVIFRHPVRKNPDGSAVRVRRGLGTKVKEDAQKLVDQMNEILGDISFWTPQAKAKAESLFDARIVNAFFDQLLPATQDAWALRGEIIPIPGPAEGYARARFLGTTGAGKTTLVRQFIGTNPATERFPSTSTAKTTVCDIEIVMAEGPFKAVVTFFPREQVRLLIEECALAAATTSMFETGKLTSAASRLLEHSEQRFRLSYVLGTLKENAEEPSDEEDEAATPAADELPEVTDAEREAMSEQIREYVGRIEAIAADTGIETERELGVNLKGMEKKDLDVFQELFEHQLRQREDFHALVDEILDRVEERFEGLASEGFQRNERPRRVHSDGEPVFEQLRAELRETADPAGAGHPSARAVQTGVASRRGMQAGPDGRRRAGSHAGFEREHLDKHHATPERNRRSGAGGQRGAANAGGAAGAAAHAGGERPRKQADRMLHAFRRREG